VPGCRFLKSGGDMAVKKTAPDRDKNIELFARVWRIEKERLEDKLIY
jgi:hypothetical protein